MRETESLYKWWKEERPGRKSPLDNESLVIPDIKWEKIDDDPAGNYKLVIEDTEQYDAYKKASDEHMMLEDQWLEEDQKNLHRLVDVRSFLWT